MIIPNSYLIDGNKANSWGSHNFLYAHSFEGFQSFPPVMFLNV